MADRKIVPGGALRGEATLPGDKSISHRYAILAALAEGASEIRHFAAADDCARTLSCLEALGVEVRREPDRITIVGVGLDGLRTPGVDLDAGNSGTTLRMLAGVLAGQRFDSTLTGDSSVQRRPMRRIVDPLTRMGARIEARDGEYPPLRIHGVALRPIRYETPVPSAQVKSCLLLAGLFAEGATTVVEPVPTRDHTELALTEFGARLARGPGAAILAGRPRLAGRPLDVPGDVSSAVFLMAAALVLPGSELTVRDVGLNPTRTAAIEFLASMGAPVNVTVTGTIAGEARGDVAVRYGPLEGGVVSGAASAKMIDELPMLAALGPYTRRGITILDARELRVKESDRIAALADNLRRMGARAEALADGLTVAGRRPEPLGGAEIDPRGDHRIAMAMAIAALGAARDSTIHDADCAAVSFPGFFECLDRLLERRQTAST
ncbi:MAG TPA: 3-phosphoshikimate 1-carboxyvinyltransferase [Candidatus Acidoferrales bacterium]|nr:3-phosphoshikimate 1-carboxyvinyltransferase [Candidatus Acidoferrales bacterium]